MAGNESDARGAGGVRTRRPNQTGTVFWWASRKKYAAEIEIDGRPVRRTAPSEDAAYEILAQLKLQVEQSALSSTADQTLAQYLAEWLLYKKDCGDLREWSWVRYRNDLQHVVRNLGTMKLSEVRPIHIQRLYAKLLKHMSAATLNGLHQVLRQAFSYAVDVELIDRNPAAKVRRPRMTIHEPDRLLADELSDLLRVSEGTRWHALWLLMGALGLRVSEARALTWSDIDWQHGQVKVEKTVTYDEAGQRIIGPPKSTHSNRHPAMGEAVRTALDAHRTILARDGRTWGPTDLVFPRITDADFLDRSTIAKALTRDLAAAGLRRITPHQLRHTAASLHLEDGASVRDVQVLMGHSSRTMTLHYAHASDQSQQAMMHRLDDRLRRKA